MYRNDFCVVVGKSGVGKSTLVRFILGDIKFPLRTIYHKREDLARYSDFEIQMYRRKIGIVFQDYKLMDDLSVKENITYPLFLYDVPEETIDRKFRKYKQKLALHELENLPVKFLSGGEKQKVAIARALIHEPEFIIADEPTGNLDREHTQQIADLLIESHQQGNTVLLITHDIHLLEYLKIKQKESLTLFKM
ncbi:MAG: ATP-binding cassette domain-containing protein [bacterium]|nr:ATP-binding cassette domain-containing protein [bacterium]